jgi:hypothetical protein
VWLLWLPASSAFFRPSPGYLRAQYQAQRIELARIRSSRERFQRGVSRAGLRACAGVARRAPDGPLNGRARALITISLEAYGTLTLARRVGARLAVAYRKGTRISQGLAEVPPRLRRDVGLAVVATLSKGYDLEYT